MDGFRQLADLFWGMFAQSPVAFIAAVLMLYFIFKNRFWHAMYSYALLMGAYIVSQTVGISEFIGGVIVGVIANEVFRFLRERLDQEK